MNTVREQWYDGLRRYGAAIDRYDPPDTSTSQGLLDAAVATPPGATLPKAAAAAPVLIDNRSLAVLDVEGEDAKSFLQAQFCNDLMGMPDNAAQLNGYCSPKGRLLALFTLWPIDTGYRLVLPVTLIETFVKRLTMFVLRARVRMRRRDDLLILGLLTRAQRGTDMPLPEALWQVTTQADLTAVHVPGELLGAQRYLMVGTPEATIAWLDTLPGETALTGEALWRLGDILAGIPRIDAVNSEAFVPQMVNLQAIDALSFRKGCYPGQEIVARMQYLGKLKRRMGRYHQVDGATDAAAGETLYTPDGVETGRIVDCVRAGDALQLLAVTRVDSASQGLRLHDQPLECMPLPYTLDTNGEIAPQRTATEQSAS